jgi:hypothetical protein
MRIARAASGTVGAVLVWLSACSSPGTTVIVVHDPAPEASTGAALDAGAVVDAAVDARVEDAADAAAADAAVDAPPNPSASCYRDAQYDSYCAGDAGHAGPGGLPNPYAYTCDGVVGHYAGANCISSGALMLVRWCCPTLQGY